MPPLSDDKVLASIVMGVGITVLLYVIAFAFMILSRQLSPDSYQSMQRRVTRIFIFLAAAGLVATMMLALICLIATLIGGTTRFEVSDAPFASTPLGLALAFVIAPRITSWARHWAISAAIIAVALSCTIIVGTLPITGHP